MEIKGGLGSGERGEEASVSVPVLLWLEMFEQGAGRGRAPIPPLFEQGGGLWCVDTVDPGAIERAEELPLRKFVLLTLRASTTTQK